MQILSNLPAKVLKEILKIEKCKKYYVLCINYTFEKNPSCSLSKVIKYWAKLEHEQANHRANNLVTEDLTWNNLTSDLFGIWIKCYLKGICFDWYVCLTQQTHFILGTMVVRTMCLECEAVTEKAQAVCELCVPVTDDEQEEEPFKAACLSTEYLRDQNKVSLQTQAISFQGWLFKSKQLTSCLNLCALQYSQTLTVLICLISG